MKPADVERWVVETIERIARGLRIEDDRVELKRQLPFDHHQAARRIAGHANQVREDRILWVIGLDDRPGGTSVLGIPGDAPDIGDWWGPVKARFDEVAPSPTWVYVSHEGRTVLGLGFETDRGPYVVKTSGNGPSREVPWREGTHIRSATRYDLLRLLVPILRRPELQVLGGTIAASPRETQHERGWSWIGSVSLYVVTAEPLILPDHMCSASLTMAGQQFVLEAYCSLPQRLVRLQGRRFEPEVPVGSVAFRGDAQLLVEKSTPITVELRAETKFYGSPVVPGTPGRLTIQLGVAGIGQRVVVLDTILRSIPPDDQSTAMWSIGLDG